jgi:hypothetical protein
MLMEVTVRGILIAEVYDYGRDGYLDQLFLVNSHGNYGVYQERRGYEPRGYDDEWWDDDRWEDGRGNDKRKRYPGPGPRR